MVKFLCKVWRERAHAFRLACKHFCQPAASSCRGEVIEPGAGFAGEAERVGLCPLTCPIAALGANARGPDGNAFVGPFRYLVQLPAALLFNGGVRHLVNQHSQNLIFGDQVRVDENPLVSLRSRSSRYWDMTLKTSGTAHQNGELLGGVAQFALQLQERRWHGGRNTRGGIGCIGSRQDVAWQLGAEFLGVGRG
ncbi:hypothetical protein ASC83_22695 [Acidovorax sp. Root402]|nr:hypothetical protein ASC83_22695 [Acidovorax sp. Root402]